MVKMPRFETSCLEMGVKTLVTETGQQLPPSIITAVNIGKVWSCFMLSSVCYFTCDCILIVKFFSSTHKIL